MGLILEEIINLQFKNFIKTSKKIPMKLCIYYYNEEMENIHIVWDTGKNWWFPDANTRYDSDFKNKISECLKPLSLQTDNEYACRIKLLTFKEIIERNYYLMNLK